MNDNRAALDDASLPGDDLEVFLAKVDSRRMRGRRVLWTVTASLAAAAAVLVFAAVHAYGTPAESPERIYSSYLAYVEDARAAMVEKGAGEEWLDCLEDLTSESVPLDLLLGDGLPEAERNSLLSEHYSRIEEGIDTLLDICTR